MDLIDQTMSCRGVLGASAKVEGVGTSVGGVALILVLVITSKHLFLLVDASAESIETLWKTVTSIVTIHSWVSLVLQKI